MCSLEHDLEAHGFSDHQEGNCGTVWKLRNKKEKGLHEIHHASP